MNYKPLKTRLLILILVGTLRLEVQSSTLQAHLKQTQVTDLERRAKDFIAAKEKSYQSTATKDDVEGVLVFCSDSIQYDHVLSPDKRFSFTGKEDWRRGQIAHLGETRNVKLRILNSIHRQNIVVIEFSIYREIETANEWKGSITNTVSIIEFDKTNKIIRLVDYLQQIWLPVRHLG